MKKEHFGQLDKKVESQNQKEKQPGLELFIAMFSSRKKSGTTHTHKKWDSRIFISSKTDLNSNKTSRITCLTPT